MPQNDYWEERFLLLMEMLLKQGDDYIQHSANNYIATMAEIEKDINNFYMRFANENGITYQQAKQLLTSEQRQAFQMEIDDYIAYGQQNGLDDMWIKKLENASTLHRITRLQAIQYQLRQQVEKLEAQKIKGLTETFQNIYTESCYRTAYEIQKGTGVGSAFSKIDENKINKVLSRAWAPDGKNFSERVWGTDRTQLIYQLQTRFTQGIIRGEGSQKIIKDMSKALYSSRKATERLVLTESAFVASASRKDTYENLGVKQYKVLATLDIKTSEICRKMDGKIFDLKDYKIGLTANPFHPRCRSTTVPNIDSKYIQNQQRAARNKEGKTYYVPSDMTYEQWHKTYVEADPEWLLQEKKHKNKSADKKQYEQYKAVLGRKEVGSFDDFQNMKHSDSEKWSGFKKKYAERSPNSNIEKFKVEASKQLENLTEQQKTALKKYTGNSAYQINRKLAKGEDLGKYAEQAELISSALQKCEIPRDVIVQRKTILEHLNIPDEIVQQIKNNKNLIVLLKNKVIINKSFTSTSIIDFDYPPRDVVIKFKVPKGYKGAAYIKNVAYQKYQNQQEVLFDRGLKYKIVSARIENNNYCLEAEVIL